MKWYLKWFAIFLLMFIIVSVLSKLFIYSMYKPKQAKVLTENPKIEIIDSKATNANGYIYACITNSTGNKLENKYIKIDCFSSKGNNINSGYAKISSMENNESQYFKMRYECEKTDRVELSVVDDAPTYIVNPINVKLTDTQKFALVVGGMIVIYYMPAGYLFGIFPF